MHFKLSRKTLGLVFIIDIAFGRDAALISPGGRAIGRDGSMYVSRFASLPGAGDVVRIRR
jgi:hypothetical protein